MHTWEYCWDQGQKELQGFKTISFLLEKTLTVRNGRALGSIEQLFQGKFKCNLRRIEMTSVWFSFCKIHSKSNLWQQTAATSIDQCFEWKKRKKKAMAILIGHLSYKMPFKESERDKHILSARVWEMNTSFCNNPWLVQELWWYLQAAWPSALPEEPTSGQSTSIHIHEI